jgi:divalent metal cation (Fe/Co/Zn/Cd) transporter
LFGDMLHYPTGAVTLVVIASTAALVDSQAITRLSDPQEMRHTNWVALADVIGFVGHELVTRYRITVGRRIGSAALITNGLYA